MDSVLVIFLSWAHFLLVASGAGNLTGDCLILVEHLGGSSVVYMLGVGDCAGLEGELGGTGSGRGSCGKFQEI